MHATNSEKVLVTTSTKESAILETHFPHKKQETTLMNAYKLGGGTCNDERRWECMFRDPFTLAKTKMRLIHAKFSEKVPVTMSTNESAVLETL